MIEEAAALPEPLAGCGFVYVATGAAFIAEAAESARSLRRFHREPICLVTNAPVAQPPFDQIVVRSELRGDVSAKLAMDACPYDRFVFLDTDTAIVAPLHELFQLLEAFDLGVPAALGGYHYSLPGVSPAFREPATNVIALRRGPAVADFFTRWRRAFADHASTMGREWDQRSFRQAAYETPGLRLCFLGAEWSLSPYPGDVVCREVKIFHGRPRAYLSAMEKAVNRRTGYRVFWRGLGCLREPADMSPRDFLRLFLTVLREATKAAIRWIRDCFRRKPRPMGHGANPSPSE